ncbi:hypothetical protein EJ05DRAFT_506744 [Pseudovirgaria hyperparasitica]|uniref:Uncharacterized protein n=1 Tax=Pseudovirgaria hyperparasitica TaxID=470096 RepID=A0A6A6WLL4_9PEZI|nr:uncharacterized protein EJ05DRAFT_506744 [Pseudovirgaria hyperparasitica]KAF2763110.1 hypothetical protein EJ05DRAFT_506744 [Pseudovirgaria hyperparasitica]
MAFLAGLAPFAGMAPASIASLGYSLTSSSVSLTSSSLSLVNFHRSKLAREGPHGPVIRIKVGGEPREGEAFGGRIDGVWTYNALDERRGTAKGSNIGAADYHDFSIESPVWGELANYVNVKAGNDAVCIAWIGVTQKDGSDSDGAWNGDIGAACGQSWFHQYEVAGRCDDCKDGLFIPRCTWLDGDHTNDIVSKSMKFNVLAYSNSSVPKTKLDGIVCDAAIYGNHDEIPGRPAGPSGGNIETKRDGVAIAKSLKPRGVPPRKRWMKDRLVVSHVPGHDASELCNSKTSWGPDFVANGFFCDMETKTLHPLCENNPIEGCHELDTSTKTIQRRATVAKREAIIPHKSYSNVKKWTAGQSEDL